jgi:hypothetical protein
MFARLIPTAAPGLLILPLGLLLLWALGHALGSNLGTAVGPLGGARWLLPLSLALCAVSWLGTLLGALGILRPLTLLAALALAVLLVGHPWRRPTALGAAPRMSGLEWAGTATLLLLAACVVARPAETWLLLDDAGVYTLGGLALARHGTLSLQLGGAWPSTAELQRWLYELSATGLSPRHFGPFFPWLLGQETLEIGFLPLPKVWTAWSVWLFGPAQAIWTTPLAGLLGLGFLVGLVRASEGWPVALLAGTLVALSFPFIWFARYPLSEAYTLAILFAGLLQFSMARRLEPDDQNRQRLLAWGGATLALLVVTRFEALLLLAALLGMLWLAWPTEATQRARDFRTLGAALAISAALGLVVDLGVARYYLFDQLLRALPVELVPRLLAGGLVGAAFLWLAFRTARRRSLLTWGAPLARPLAAALWLVGLLLAAWRLMQPGAHSLPDWVALYLTPIGLFLGAAGLLLWLLARHSEPEQPELLAVVTLAGLLWCVYCLRPMVTPVQPWATRRVVPVILPCLASGASSLLLSLGQTAGPWLALRIPWRGLRPALTLGSCALTLTFGGALLARSADVLPHTELAGVWSQLSAWASSLPENSAVLLDNGPIGRRLPQYLELATDRPALSLPRPAGEAAQQAIDDLISTSEAAGLDTYFVSTGGDLRWWPARWQLVPVGATQLTYPTLALTQDTLPTAADIAINRTWLDVYRLSPRDPSTALADRLVTAGPGNYPFLREGFYGVEGSPEAGFTRWTGGLARIILPWPPEAAGQPAQLDLTVAGGRYVSDLCHLSVAVQGAPVAELDLPNAFAPSTFHWLIPHLASNDQGEVEITLQCNTWAPGQGDPRELGCIFHSLHLSAVPSGAAAD